MRIALDTTALPDHPVGGGRYIIQLVRALSVLQNEFEIFIISQRSRRDLFNLQHTPELHWVEIPDFKPMQRLVWEQFGLPRLVKQLDIQLLHSLHYTRPVSISCASVVTFHDMSFFLFPQLHTLPKRLFFPLAIRYSARHANALIAISENTRQDAIRILNINPQKISTVHLGVDHRFFLPSNEQELRKIKDKYRLPDTFILFVGLVEPRKNLPLLIQSFYELHKTGIETRLVIVGRKGWMYQRVYDLVDNLGLRDKIIFTGYITDDDLPVVYKLASVLVYPTLYEGFGFPPLEAMASGTPVITSRISSLPEVVGDGGVLIPTDNIPALVEALRNVLLKHEYRVNLIDAGFQQASRFSWKRTADQTLNVYREVIGL